MDNLSGLWPDDILVQHTGGGEQFRMLSGREYLLSSSLLASQPDIAIKAAAQLTRYIDEHPEEDPVVFTTYNVPQILGRAPIRLSDQATRTMHEIVRLLHGRPGDLDFDWDHQKTTGLMRSAYLTNRNDLRAILQHLRDQGLIALLETNTSFRIKVSASALIHLETDLALAESDTAFVAMWFGQEMSSFYDTAIAPAVEQAGYRPIRIDRQQHNNKIDDEIIAEVRRSRFIIADFSCGEDGARGGVYYEAGFAAGLGKPVIYMVRETDLERIHFDTRQFNHIIWNENADLKKSLFNRIAATIGERSSSA